VIACFEAAMDDGESDFMAAVLGVLRDRKKWTAASCET
jgi:hypothetical protein